VAIGIAVFYVLRPKVKAAEWFISWVGRRCQGYVDWASANFARRQRMRLTTSVA